MRNLFSWLPFGRVPEVSAGELHQLLIETSVQLIDVRTPGEWRESRIEGAINLPITSFASGIGQVELDPAVPVVAICLSAHRSVPAVRALRNMGFAEARQLQGGMRAWWRAGLPVVQGQ